MADLNHFDGRRIVFFREPDDEDQDDGEDRKVNWKEIDRHLTGRLKRQAKDFEKVLEEKLKGINFDSAFEKIEKLLGPDPEPAGDSAPDDGKDDANLPAGFKERFQNLERELERTKRRAEETEKSRIEAEQRVTNERRKNNLERLFKAAGARNETQCYKLTIDQMVEDSELGDVFPVKTDLGDDVVTPDKFVEHFKEENPHLFESEDSGRQGSSSSNGSLGGRKKPTYKADDFKDPLSGGMAHGDYERDREKIHNYWESQVKGG